MTCPACLEPVGKGDRTDLSKGFWRYRAGVKNGRNKSNGKPMVRTNVPKKVGFYQRNNERYAERYISG
jgi:hypothetical protein